MNNETGLQCGLAEGLRCGQFVYGADGDHLKKMEDIDVALAAEMPMITLDLSEVMNASAGDWSAEKIEEAFAALPAADRDYHSEKYRKLCYRVYKIMCSTRIGKVCASDHAMSAVEEMAAMNEGLKGFFDAHGASYPTYRALEADAQKHLESRTDRGERRI